MRNATLLSSSLTLLALTAASPAAPFYEPFDYTPSSTLDGQVAPNSKTWSVAGSPAPAISVISPTLTPPAQLLASGGAAVQLGNNAGVNSSASDRIGIGTYNSGTVYWSLLVRIDDPAGLVGGTTGAFVAGFNTNEGAQTSNIQTAVSRLVLRKDPTNPASFNFGTSVNSNNGSPGNPQVFDSTPRSADTTYFLVGSYTFNPNANDDLAQLWINPDPSSFGTSTPPTPNLTSTGADVNAFNSFFLRQNPNAPAQLTIDDLRVSSNYADVTPLAAVAPEPATLTLAALAALPLLTRRRR